jgi:hypothetical protein
MTSYVTRQTKVSEVSSWDEIYYSPWATVYEAANFFGFYKVKNPKKTKYFKGETAWMDIQRYVSDLGDRNAYNIFR